MNEEKVLVTIAARGGSKGLKDKNILDLCGRPLIAHTILQAKQWGRADRIVVSTDSKRIGSIARRYGALVPFMRPAGLATDKAGKLEVLRHALKAMERSDGRKYDVVVDLDVTAPIRKISDIEGAYRLFVRKRPKSVFSVAPSRRNPYFNMVEIDSKGYAVLVKKTAMVLKRRQDAPQVYDMNASIYVYDRGYLLNEGTKSSVSDRSLVWVMDELSAFDIDSSYDLRFVEFLVSEGLVRL